MKWLKKNDLSSFETHVFWIGKPCFHASMQRDFSLFIQIKLNFGVTSWCFVCFFFFFFGFSRCMVTFLTNHLNFQNSFVLDKHQHDFCFCTKLWIPKNSCEHVRSCIVFEEKGNTPKDFWRNGFMFKGHAHYIINHKSSFDNESLVEFWAKLPPKTGTGWNKKSSFVGMIE